MNDWPKRNDPLIEVLPGGNGIAITKGFISFTMDIEEATRFALKLIRTINEEARR